ncbi:TrkH family potassium uptake protein [Actinotignum urinale]|uniref:Potassium transporter TrkG n=1 Tax=Actinotignum urinale TaxID=190146 RepID=A0ABU5G8D8_9ACTO|nr:potassium transporter TrkG [Actinotignum urinale]MDY5132940.1 potassium transporter TrkG [Actinotignum urinale]
MTEKPQVSSGTQQRGFASFSVRIREMLNKIARDRPAQLALLIFAVIIFVFTALLSLPISTASGKRAKFIDAFFTATSSVCVTGLTTVDTATYWSPVGQFFISAGLIIGGLGVMTLAAILGRAVSRHVGLTQRMLTAEENQSSLGDVGAIVRAVLIVSLTAHSILLISLLPFFLNKGEPLLASLSHSYFMAVSIFNNGGFVAMREGVLPYVGNWGLTIPVIFGTIAGAIGFPVVLDMWRHRTRPRKWSITTKIVLVTYISLLILGAVAFAAIEWNNPNTLGQLSTAGKINASLSLSTVTRSTGLATLDVGQMGETSWLLISTLMFIGGGSASAAGGIKVTTFAILLLAIRAEARGDRDTEVFGKRLPPEVLRLAISATFAGTVMVGTGCVALLQMTNFSFSQILVEVISAFATCGLSTGITSALPFGAKLVLILLMFFGRTGIMTLAAALALRSRRRTIRLPEERPLIG